MLIAFNHHYVRPSFAEPHPGIHGVTPDELRHQVETLQQHGTFVSPRQVADAVRGKARLPDRALLLTFDDGLREQIDHALPVLDDLEVPAAFYANTRPIVDGVVSTVHKIHLVRAHTDPTKLVTMLSELANDAGIPLDLEDVPHEAATAQYRYDAPETARLKFLLNFVLRPADREQLIERLFAERFPDEAGIAAGLYMDTDHLRDLASRDELGTHAHDHVPLGTLDVADAAKQVTDSLDTIEGLTGHKVHSLSYPYGSWPACSYSAAMAAARRGGSFALTTERAANPDLEHPFTLARYACNDVPGGSSPILDADSMFDKAPHASWRFSQHPIPIAPEARR